MFEYIICAKFEQLHKTMKKAYKLLVLNEDI